MRTTLKRLSLVVAALALIGTAWSSSAEARWHGGGWRGGGWGWGGPAFVGGLALGAYAASPYYGYGYPYGGGCVRNRVVGYTPYGRPIVRPVNVCY